MIFGHELEPEAYTVDADFLNGDAGIAAVLGNPATEIVARCEEFGFAVVRNVLSGPDFDVLYQDSQAVLVHHDERGWTQHVESMSVTKVDKTMERRTNLPDRSRALIENFAAHLGKVARIGDRIYTEDERIDTVYVVRQLRGSQVGKHRDPVSGVMCELSLQGTAMMGFWRGKHKLAAAALRPNDMVVMPARTAAHTTGPRRPVKHNVINVTRKRNQGGERLALLYNYGRIRQAE